MGGRFYRGLGERPNGKLRQIYEVILKWIRD
jgi:hypothetical protein